MLRNEAYIGQAHWYSTISVEPKKPHNKGKYRKIKKSSTRARPRSEWMHVPVPAIVDEALFNKARERLAEHSTYCPRNKKYEYLLGQKIECICGQKRIGAARQRGKYLYYDCCDKVLCFPLPRKCRENAISARVADELVWGRISSLMASPELLSRQVERWMGDRRAKNKVAVHDTSGMEKRVKTLKQQEERYNKAYGAGLYSVEQLKEQVLPIRDQIAALEQQIGLARREADRSELNPAPTKAEIRAFTTKAKAALNDLKFEQKRAIVLNTVEKIVGTQQQLQVFGYIPVTNNGWYKTKDRHCRSAERGEIHAL